jgi:CheY-like chemotaxis protein
MVHMDPSQLDQILVNLCVNARDSISGAGEIFIETGVVDLDGDYCMAHPGFVPGKYALLAVSDTGRGMSPEIMKHLFEPFFTTKELGKGTGLGLATVYGIVKQNNGFIDVESKPGKGSVFRIYLPLHYEGEAENQVLTVATVPALKGTILLVEDESMILDIVKTMISQLGYNVLAASTPGAALDLAKNRSGEIDLLITDVVMPEMNGRELAAEVCLAHPLVRILYMSGYTADVIANHGVLEEGVYFIQKPFSVKDLAAKVHQVLAVPE